MDEIFIANTPREFATYVVEEVARWASEGCPIMFEARALRTGLFTSLHDHNPLQSSLKVGYSKDGYVTIKIIPPGSLSEGAFITRFQVGNPKLEENLIACFEKLNSGDLSDFITLADARAKWKVST